MPLFRRHARLLACLALGAALGSCGSEVTTPQSLAYGTYELRWINGDPPPARTGDVDGEMVEVLAGTVIANRDQTCEFRHTYRMTSSEAEQPRVVSESDPCTWQLIGSGFHVRFPNGSLLSALLTRDALWFDFPDGFGGGFRFVYERVGGPPS